MKLTTERCLIRPFTEDDWQDVYAYTSDPAVMKYIPGGVFSKEDAQEFVKNNRLKTARNFFKRGSYMHPAYRISPILW